MYYFIVNAHGGSGRALKTWQKLKAILEKKRVAFTFFLTKEKGHGFSLAQDLCASIQKTFVLCVVGGDGTINEVLNGLFAFKLPHQKTGLNLVRFAIIPSGSGNDFARGAKIPRNAKKALSLLLSSPLECSLDVGRITLKDGTMRVFGISAGLGMDAIVCKSASESKLKTVLNTLHLGSLVYLFLTVKTLFRMQTSSVTVRDDSESYTFDKLIFLSAMNFSQEGGGVTIFPKASALDKELSFCLASGISKAKAFLDLPLLVLALHAKRNGFRLWQSKNIEVHITPPTILHTDGEYVGNIDYVKIECLPSALTFLGSKKTAVQKSEKK